MELKQTERKDAKIKMALKGTSGSGKSLGALLISKGLCNGDLSKVAVIDSENSIELYSHIGNFNVLNLTAPFSPERYIAAIDFCEKAGMEVLILDSISHCWHHLLLLHGAMAGNSFTNWNRITPLYNNFVYKLHQSPCHIIATIRSKQDYLIETKDNKTVITKVGTRVVQRNEIEYEFTTVLDINANHKAKATKDRTGLFTDKPEFLITEGTGKDIQEWCNCNIKVDDVRAEIKKATNIEQLNTIYHKHPTYYNMLSNDFSKQKELLNYPTNNKTVSVNNNLNN